MKKINALVILVCLLLLSEAGRSQEEAAAKQENAEFKIGAFYISHLNYYGRTDSLRSAGFFPLGELAFNKNLYINACPIFVSNKISRFEYAGTVATLGYRFEPSQKFAGHIYLVKPFYKENSELVQSSLKAQLAATISRKGSVMNITLGADAKFSDNTDYGITAGLDHNFQWNLSSASLLVITPSVYTYGGTQRFTETYYKQTGIPLLPGTPQAFTRSVDDFNILSYEFSVPIVFAKGGLQFIFLPAYVIPQNLVSVEGRPDLSERGQNMFYGTAGVKMSL